MRHDLSVAGRRQLEPRQPTKRLGKQQRQRLARRRRKQRIGIERLQIHLGALNPTTYGVHATCIHRRHAMLHRQKLLALTLLCPATVVIVRKRNAAQTKACRRTLTGQLDAHHHARVVSQQSVTAQLQAIGKSRRGQHAPMKRQIDGDVKARQQHKHDQRQHKRHKPCPGGRQQKRRTDDATRVEDALDLDALALCRLTVTARQVLEQVVFFHLATKMKQRQRPDHRHDVHEQQDRVDHAAFDKRRAE